MGTNIKENTKPICFFFMKRERGTPKQCPPVVIKTMTEDTDHELQGFNS